MIEGTETLAGSCTTLWDTFLRLVHVFGLPAEQATLTLTLTSVSLS